MSELENQTGNYYDVSKYKVGRAKEDLVAAEIVFEKDLFKAANNRAYYAVFHAIDAILALEPIAFKKHKDTLAYFNKNYIHTEKFPRDMGRKVAKLEEIRHKSDYDDFYIASKEEAAKQIVTAKLVIELVAEYIENQK